MNNFINLAHLKFFCDTIVFQSISEAAKNNFISQSAISQAITKLESLFGVPLLIRNTQSVTLTKQGRIVFDRAPEIFKKINETFVEVENTKDMISGTLKFMTTKSLGMSFYAPTYSKIKKNLPNLNVEIQMGGRTKIRTALRRGEIETAIVVYDHTFSEFEKYPIRKGYFNLYQSKNAPQDFINKGVFIDQNLGMHIENLKNFLLNNIHPLLALPIAGWELVANFTNLGSGVGFFPDYIATEVRFPNIEIHPLKIPPFEYEIVAIYNKSTLLSKAAYSFIEQFTLE